MAGWLRYSEVNFVSLQSAVFCSECELISQNNTPSCLACGSKALLSLSRVLGGSLHGQSTAHLIADAELDRLVRSLLQTLAPVPSLFAERQNDSPLTSNFPVRHHIRALSSAQPAGVSKENAGSDLLVHPGELDLEPAISVIAERAQTLTGATGAAIALRNGDEIVCRARAGRTAPDLGVRLQTDAGISADCVRTGEVLICNDAEVNPHVDLASCRRLGVRSILVAPLRHIRRTLGVFEVLSSTPNAFDHNDVATMQMLASMMVAAISRLSHLRPLARPAS